MKWAKTAILAAVVLVVLLGSSGLVYYMHFYRHEAQLAADLDRYRENASGYQRWLDGRPPVEPRLREFADATLGFDAETVESRFRSGLNRMAASAGLVRQDTVVTSRPTPRAIPNPVLAQRRPVREFSRYMRLEGIDVPDAYLVDAEIRGSGQLDAAVRLLALAQSQPWIWSVRRFSLVPQGNQTEVFDISVGVTTAVLPDLAPPVSEEEGETRPLADPPPIRDPDAEVLLATTEIVTRNVFAPPPPAPPDPDPVVEVAQAPPQADPKPQPKPKPPPPYHEWRLTAFSQSPTQGKLAWLLNTRTGAAVRLSPGEGILDAFLVDEGGEQVVFTIGEARYTLSLNQTLADRRPLD